MIVGVDVSSRRVDLAWLEDGKPQRWHQELAKGHLIDRLREIRIQWPGGRSIHGAHTSGSEPAYEFSPLVACIGWTRILEQQAALA